VELIGFFDTDGNKSKNTSEEFSLHAFNSLQELIDASDAVDIVTPTLSHYDCAVKAVKNSKHVFIEKPITNTVDEAKKLIALAKEADIKAQVGHVERFNAAFRAAKKFFMSRCLLKRIVWRNSIRAEPMFPLSTI